MDFNESVINKIKKREKETLIQFYKEYANRLAYFVDNIINNTEDAKDIAYDLMVEIPDLIRKYNFKRYDCKNQFVSLIYKIAKNRAFNYLRKRKKNIIINTDVKIMENKEPMELMYLFKISDLKEVLNEELYSIIYMKYVQGYKIKEIAEILSLTEDQIKKRLVKAYVKSRSFLDEVYGL